MNHVLGRFTNITSKSSILLRLSRPVGLRGIQSSGPRDQTTAVAEQERPEDELDARILRHRRGLHVDPRLFKLYTKSHIPELLKRKLGADHGLDTAGYLAAASVLPMRANTYVVDELIDWNKVPNDPIFQLTFPQPEMLRADDRELVKRMLAADINRTTLRDAAEKIRASMNPHPAGQKVYNVPRVDGQPLPGLQHKYREVVLFFPSEGQFCHSFCTYCFRWAQFTSVGSSQMFQSSDARLLMAYLRQHPNISDLLITGGDPMVMTSHQMRAYLEPLIMQEPGLDHISNVRIGTKSLAYWPYRFLYDPDADDILRLLEGVVASGRHLAFMAHFTHTKELCTPAVQEAIRRIRMTGAEIRSQAPVVRYVNDDPVVWASMWRTQVRLGIVPYYFFVERDTGPQHYFEISLERSLQIYTQALQSVTGIARTVRGPSASVSPGKVHILGISEIRGEKVFVLRFLQSRNPSWIGQVFFAKYDPDVTFPTDLKPAFGEDKFFFEDELEAIETDTRVSGELFNYPQGLKYSNLVIN